MPKRPLVRGQPQQRAPHERVERRMRERAHRPGRGRVEARSRDRPARRASSPTGVSNSARIRGALGGDRVGEEIASAVLLVVVAAAPRPLRLSRSAAPPRWRRPRSSRPRRPAQRARRPARRCDGTAPRRQVEAFEEADDAPRLPSVSRRGERDRHRARVAGPDVGPALAGAGHDRTAALVGERVQDEQRLPVHPPCPGRRAGCPAAGPPQASGDPHGRRRARPASGPSRSGLAAEAWRLSAARCSAAGSAAEPSRSRDPPEARAAPMASRATNADRCPQRFHRPNAISLLASRSLAFAQQASALRFPGEVAQLVEHTTENRGVVGSIPTLAIPWQCGLRLSPKGEPQSCLGN